jgi:ATP-binding cassette subfamily B protein
MMIRGPGPDESANRQRIRPGTAKRVLPYAKRYRGMIAALFAVSTVNAAIAVSIPVLFKFLIDEGIMPGDGGVVAAISLTVVGLALVAALLGYGEAWYAAQIGEGLVYELRTTVFDHVQRQPLAFFTRAQTGALVSRLNTDVMSAQMSSISLLSTVVPGAVTVLFVLGAMFYLSWVVGLISLVILPLFILPGKIIGRRLQRLTREVMQTNAELGSMMNERFNVAGALLAKLYGRPRTESQHFSRLAGKARDVGARTVVNGKLMFVSVTLLTSLVTALVFGLGGGLVIQGAFQIGTLVALTTLLQRLFGPIGMLANAQADVLTSLVSFDRLFEVLDLKPLIREKPKAVALPAARNGAGAPDIQFDNVSFRYPKASEVSLASLESIALPMPERATDTWTLRETSFTVPAGKLTALVGPSGAGKTTITHLVPRLYDPTEGTVRIDGHDVRDLTLESIAQTIGTVTQDASMFHTTIRENLLYARPEASEQELIEACQAAQIWDLIEALPNGFDTVVGDRGYRLSGGEKQRIAMARLLLKAPPVVILDEATAHLDSESEAALQRALKTALAGRTSLVIAHRLSTIREADQILVIDKGRVVERGTHEELLARGELYAELYRTQFSGKPVRREPAPVPEPVGAGGRGAHFHGGPVPGGGPVPFHGGDGAGQFRGGGPMAHPGGDGPGTYLSGPRPVRGGPGHPPGPGRAPDGTPPVPSGD